MEVGGQDEEEVPGCAGSPAPSVEIMYLWSSYLLAYTVISLISLIMMSTDNELIMQTAN